MRLRPILDNIIVKRDPIKSLSSTIVAAGVDKTSLGTVVSVGPGKDMPDGTVQKPAVEVGDRICFLYFKDRPVYGYIDNCEVMMITENDIICGI